MQCDSCACFKADHEVPKHCQSNVKGVGFNDSGKLLYDPCPGFKPRDLVVGAAEKFLRLMEVKEGEIRLRKTPCKDLVNPLAVQLLSHFIQQVVDNATDTAIKMGRHCYDNMKLAEAAVEITKVQLVETLNALEPFVKSDEFRYEFQGNLAQRCTRTSCASNKGGACQDIWKDYVACNDSDMFKCTTALLKKHGR